MSVSQVKSRGVKADLWQMLLWFISICPALCIEHASLSTGRGASALGQNRSLRHTPQGFLLTVIFQSCEILWNVRICQGCTSEWHRLFHAHNILIQKKTLCTSAHRLGIKMWESPPLVPFSVHDNKMQEDIILPVTHKLLSIEWNTENSLTFRWADNFL